MRAQMLRMLPKLSSVKHLRFKGTLVAPTDLPPRDWWTALGDFASLREDPIGRAFFSQIETAHFDVFGTSMVSGHQPFVITHETERFKRMLEACNNLKTVSISNKDHHHDDFGPVYVMEFCGVMKEHQTLEHIQLIRGNIHLFEIGLILEAMDDPNGCAGLKKITLRTEDWIMDDDLGEFVRILNQTRFSVDVSIEVTNAASVNPEDFLAELRDSQSPLLAFAQTPAAVSFKKWFDIGASRSIWKWTT